MVDVQWLVLSMLSWPAELLLHSNYVFCFWVCAAAAGLLTSPLAAGFVVMGAVFALLASYGKRASPLRRYKGSLDVLLGRSYRASTLTHKMPANNNVSIAAFGDKLVIAYRKADSHFASPLARLTVATAVPQDLEDWTITWEHCTGEDDLREMLLFELNGKMFLFFARLEPFKRGFTPRCMQWTSSDNLTTWAKPLDFGRISEIVWDVQVHAPDDGKKVVYKTSYVGNHYAADAECTVLFEQSSDGMKWQPVGKESAVYSGGISEVSFAFTPRGDLVAIGRNEDGDRTGFGSQLFFASRADLGTWVPLRVSLQHRFDSPRLRCMEGELLLFARYARESYAAVPQWLPFGFQRIGNLLLYSLLPKGAAVYRICPPDQDGKFPEQPMELIRCFEETYGDTGFFSLAKTQNSDDWVIANYSSSCHSHAPWIYGQVFATDIYVCRCHLLRRS